MKKFILGIVIGGIVFGTIGSVVAYNYNAKDIGYTPSDSSWNVNNVSDAIKDLHTKKETVRVISLGDYDSLSDHQIDIKSLLPNDYANLSVNNFVILNAKVGCKSGNPVDVDNMIIDEYNSDTGILVLNRNWSRDASWYFYIKYSIGVIIGNVVIEN